MRTIEQKGNWFEGMDETRDLIKHPDLFAYQILLNEWEAAYEDYHKHKTPDSRERFVRIDTWVKSIQLHIKEVTSQIE